MLLSCNQLEAIIKKRNALRGQIRLVKTINNLEGTITVCFSLAKTEPAFHVKLMERVVSGRKYPSGARKS